MCCPGRRLLRHIETKKPIDAIAITTAPTLSPAIKPTGTSFDFASGVSVEEGINEVAMLVGPGSVIAVGHSVVVGAVSNDVDMVVVLVAWAVEKGVAAVDVSESWQPSGD